ncbi:hypothetical protein GCM10007301_15190 [Azorhizobium oxalatiphilum]|uniref:Uncharacterized protein n=1 Tax=Azorhizobium oxalatiphilum TaxID=980631 RepID=A0A917BTR6_9HYPH|nr:hypothetical protein [Azorhizobium oxalatiphilum]GGF56487.1 hypothetical protein GCM10007301_15190 [Azorhizobium oxalatiphilum]
MTFPECPADVGPGDILRCRTLAGQLPWSPLKLNHIYTVRESEGLGDVEPLQRSRMPVVHLKEIDGGPYAVFRFELVARRPDWQAECSAVAARMADVMRQREAETGRCTADDLACAGFTCAQIIEFADEARGIAGAPSQMEAV